MAFSRTFSVAPMMDWTDRHCRAFHRTLSPHSLLYTEMVTTGAILHGPRERLLAYDTAEHPVALQLGGSDPADLAACARIAEAYDYDEINLNVGCPSDRVQNGRFGACLMKEPALVSDCVGAMVEAVRVPVTVKCRIGVDEQEDFSSLSLFVERVAAAGCKTFIIHARKAWLNGLSPKENREVPPLKYDIVYGIKKAFPQLEIIINGGIQSVEDCRTHLKHVDGVMLGRAAYQNPAVLLDIEQHIFGRPERKPEMMYADLHQLVSRHLAQGYPLFTLTRHMLGLFNGYKGARAWRRILSDVARQRPDDIKVFEDAWAAVMPQPALAYAAE